MTAGKRAEKDILIVDDEPEYLQWLDEFLEANKYSVEHVTELGGALEAVGRKGYELIVVDLNIPARGTLLELVANSGPTATKYPGLIVASRARNNGYSDRKVLAYTVHSDDAVEVELAKLRISYVLKGRPQSLKRRIQSTLRLPNPK